MDNPNSNLPAFSTDRRTLILCSNFWGYCMRLSMLVGHQSNTYILYIKIFILPRVQEQDIGPTIPWSQQFGPPARPVPFLFLEPCYVSSNAVGKLYDCACLIKPWPSWKANILKCNLEQYNIYTPVPVVDNLPLAANKNILTPCSDRPMNQLLYSPFTACDGKFERLQM